MRILLLALVQLVGGCESIFELEEPCPSGYENVGVQTSRYRVITVGVDFDTQRAACSFDDPDRIHLAVIDTGDEVADLVVEMMVRDPGIDFVYVGAVQRGTATTPSGSWVWVTGDPVDNGLWGNGDPDDLDGFENHEMDAGVLRVPSARLNEAPRAAFHGAICECDGLADKSEQ